MIENKKKLVIFDFDGVLVNTLQFSFLIHKDLNQNLTWSKFQDFSNGNFHDGIGKAVKDESYIIPSEWDEHYDNNIVKLTINDILNNAIYVLQEKNIMTIVSSSGSQSIEKFLIKEGVREYFSDILGTDFHKSKIVKINFLLNKYDLKPKDAVLVTDSLGDILEANDCGVASVGVTWGIHSKEILKKGNPTAIIDSPIDLITTVDNMLI